MRFNELKKESKIWEQEGIIDTGQRNRILAMYPEKTSNVGGLIFAGLGALLIGSGIILVFAFNWEMMPVPLKLCVAFLPLSLAIAYAAFTILKRGSPACEPVVRGAGSGRYGSALFRETAGIFLALGIYSALALIGQTFHSNRELPDYVLACSIMVLPCVYLLKSTGAAAIYCAGAIFSCWEQPEWAAFLICALIVPFFVIKIIQSRSLNSIEYKFSLGSTLLLFSGILVNLILLIFLRIKDNSHEYEPLSIVLICIITLFLLDIVVMRFMHKEGIAFLSPPLALSQAAILIIVLISAASSDFFLYHNYYEADDEASHAFLQIPIAAIIMAAVYFAAAFVKFSPGGEGKFSLKLIRKFNAANLYFIFSLALLLFIQKHNILVPSNVMIFVLGVWYILLGGKKLRLKQLNLGMLLVIYLIVLRFFDMDISLLLRGIAFIILGIVFLVCNVLMFRKKKGGAE